MHDLSNNIFLSLIVEVEVALLNLPNLIDLVPAGDIWVYPMGSKWILLMLRPFVNGD